MLSEEEKIEINEILKFWNELFPFVSAYRGLKFKEAKQTISYYQNFFANNPKSLNYYYFLIRDIGWLRDEIDATQKGKEEFDKESKELITELNKLVLIIIGNIMNLPEEEREKILWEANLKFEPIFIHKEFPKEGFTSFGETKMDWEYYSQVYSKLIDITKREYPKFKKQLGEYQKWNQQQNERVAKEWGFKK